MIAVAAADQDENTGAIVRTGFSNHGAGKVTVTAPGVVWSTVPRQDDGSAAAPLPQGDYEVTARTVIDGEASSSVGPIPFSVHTDAAITYSAQILPQPGAEDDTLIVIDLGNSGATTGSSTVDIRLDGYAFETPSPSTGTVERTDRGLRWHLSLDTRQKAELRIPARTMTSEALFPVIVVE